MGTPLIEDIYYQPVSKIRTLYKDYKMDYWEKALVLCIPEAGSSLNTDVKSDIIVVYDALTHLPSIITERLFRNNYSFSEWWKLKRYLQFKYRHIKHDNGYNLKIVFNREYADIIHYKEEWWQWAVKNSTVS